MLFSNFRITNLDTRTFVCICFLAVLFVFYNTYMLYFCLVLHVYLSFSGSVRSHMTYVLWLLINFTVCL